MSRALVVLAGQSERAKASNWIAKAPVNTRVTFQGPRRSLPQNDLMWALLTDVSEQLVWHGRKYIPDDWKDYLMHQLRKGRWMPDEEGGVVPIGMHTSDLSREEMSDFIEIIHAFGARHGVTFTEPAKDRAA